MNNNSLILTPYGYVPEDKIIAIDKTMIIEVSSNKHLLVKDRKSGDVVKDYGEIDNNCSKIKNRFSDNYPGYGTAADVGNIKSFRTTWTVPEKPNDESGAVFYIWNGLDGGALQPVLSWGYHGPEYEISNWAFVGEEGYVHGDYTTVNPGDVLTGIITFEGMENDRWIYSEKFEGYPEVDIYVGRDAEALGVFEAFESYTPDPNQIPPDLYCSMHDIQLEVTDGSVLPDEFVWTPYGEEVDTPSGYNTVIVDKSTTHGEVDFYFH